MCCGYSIVREPAIGLIKWLRPKGLKVCSYVEKCAEIKNQSHKKIVWYTKVLCATELLFSTKNTCRIDTYQINAIFSSPEPKAQGELIVWDLSRRPSVRPSVHTFKHEYLSDQPADRDQISSGASLGWVIGCIRFWARSDQNSGFHGNR